MLGKIPLTARVVVLRNRLLHARADLPRESLPPRPRRWTFKVSQELPEYVDPYVTIFVGAETENTRPTSPGLSPAMVYALVLASALFVHRHTRMPVSSAAALEKGSVDAPFGSSSELQ